MASQQSEVAIANLALDYLGERPITSFSDGDTDKHPARILGRQYPACRDSVLEDGDWTFATRIYGLAELASPPNDPRPPYTGTIFQLPGDVLRVIRCDDGTNDWRLVWHRLEDRIICDSEVVYAESIVRIEDTTRFSSTFVQALAARIAAEIAYNITENSSKEERMWALYAGKIGTAQANDGRQGTSQRTRSDRLRRARR